ncbi:hypothetical protein PROFUN_15831 [Planoprotostelium fungivorum]|uniref:Uncharacterized protein n=1 Tax=Planoprotostelium fungivorum TaxID=1890364 RepID=A0A2P6MTA1_9EUKA|nr:hypothetical protein PROFUN_15831 [Planoprotostelium fungivorum]
MIHSQYQPENPNQVSREIDILHERPVETRRGPGDTSRLTGWGGFLGRRRLLRRPQFLKDTSQNPEDDMTPTSRGREAKRSSRLDIVWNGHLDVSSSFLRVIREGFQISSQLSTTSWSIHNSTLMDAILTFQFPITMEEVKSSPPRSSTIDFASGASIVNSSIDYLYQCNGCNVSNSILFKIPVRTRTIWSFYQMRRVSVYAKANIASGTSFNGSSRAAKRTHNIVEYLNDFTITK